MSGVVLVTGGAGFIGSNIVAELTADPGLDVVVCDRLRGAALGKWRNLAKHPIADFVQPEDLRAWLEGRDLEAVIHMGAVSSTTEPDADKIIINNFNLSRLLFTWCTAHDRRLIYASSAATYGDGADGFDDDSHPEALAELRPLNAYGWSKTLFDRWAVRRAARGQAPPQWAGLKFFNVYGPNESHKGEMRSVIAKIWPDVASGRPVRLFRSYRPDVPDGGQKRDFVYVRDAARVATWLLDHREVSGIFNLGSGHARSFHDLALAAFKAADVTPKIEFIDMPEGLDRQYQYFTEARIERLRAAGYDAPFASLEDGVTDYIQSYLATPDPWR